MQDAAEPFPEESNTDGTCTRCLQKVPRSASRCPSCGQPLHTLRPLAVTIGIAGVFLLMFVVLVLYRVTKEQANAPAPGDEGAPRATPAARSSGEHATPEKRRAPEERH